MERFEQALGYASRVHAGQRRKGTEIPYVAHLLAVTALVLEDGGDEDQAIAALLFAVTALQVFAGRSLNPLSEPLPFFAYPVFVFTLFGWVWWCRHPMASN